MMQRMRVHAAEALSSRGGAPARPSGGNVVPFMRPEAASSAVVKLDHDARPLPADAVSRTRLALFVTLSLALHAGVFAAFYREAPPLASVGVQSISVEIVLGTDRAAGMATTPVQAESAVDAAEALGEGPELVKPQTARLEVKTAEAQVAPAMAPEAVPQQRPESPTEVKPSEQRPAAEPETQAAAISAPILATAALATEAAPVTEPEQPVAEAAQVTTAVPDVKVEVPRPRPEPPRRVEKPPAVRKVMRPARERPAVVRRQKKDNGEDARTRESRTSSASVASSGIGRGRSDDSSNYRGIVRARLVRNLYFPPDAKRNGEEGRAVVRFFIEPSGTVSNINLQQGTGIARLDREAEATVRRSSPFPPPPSGRRELFRVPLNFDVR